MNLRGSGSGATWNWREERKEGNDVKLVLTYEIIKK